jgi:hypothetical protein
MAQALSSPPPGADPTDGKTPGWGGRVLFTCLVITVFSFVVLVFGLSQGRGTTAQDLLLGPDDMMRVVQVTDWLDGSGWYDSVQKRLDPPDGVLMHWSRLSDLPLAAGIGILQPLAGRAGALQIAVITVPALLGGIFAAIFIWAAAPLAGTARRLVPLMMTCLLLYPMHQFVPGRVDHHGLQIILALLASGLLLRAVISENAAQAAWTGVVGGLSLAIGMEGLPFLGAATITLSLFWVIRGGAESRLIAAFGAGLFVTALIAIPLTQPPVRWLSANCDQLSLVQLALTGVVVFAGVVTCGVARKRHGATWPGRLVIVGASGIAGLAAVVAVFPQCATGPYAAMPEEIMYWFRNVSEARPLLVYAGNQPGPALSSAILPVTAIGYVGWRLVRAETAERPLWLALFVLSVSGLAVMLWEVRGVSYAGLVAALALVPLAASVNRRAGEVSALLARVLMRVCVPLVAFLAVMTANMMFKSQARPWVKQLTACDVKEAARVLNDAKGLGAAPAIIAAPIFVGPKLLLLTRHRVLAGPYHRNVRGLADNRRIFAGSEKEALETIKRRGVKAVLFCPAYARYLPYGDRPPFLSNRLIAKDPPGWLTPVKLGKGYGLYLVGGTGRTGGRP